MCFHLSAACEGADLGLATKGTRYHCMLCCAVQLSTTSGALALLVFVAVVTYCKWKRII